MTCAAFNRLTCTFLIISHVMQSDTVGSRLISMNCDTDSSNNAHGLMHACMHAMYIMILCILNLQKAMAITSFRMP